VKYIFKKKLEQMTDREVYWFYLVRESQPERVFYDISTQEYLVTK